MVRNADSAAKRTLLLLRRLRALRLRACRERRDAALAGFRQRAVQFLAPVRHVSARAVDIDHVHRLAASVGELMKLRWRHVHTLTRLDRAALLAHANFPFPLDDEINLLLLLIVPRYLAAVRLENRVAHRKTLRRDRLAKLSD